MRDASAASEGSKALTRDLTSFVTGRLALILLPVRHILREQGLGNLAGAVQIAVRDIDLNMRKIVAEYSVGGKER